MHFHIITLFPESFGSYFSSSIHKRAQEQWAYTLQFYKLSDFSKKRFGHVDDKSYGMHGQILSPEPLSLAIEHIFDKRGISLPVIYLSPSWKLLTQEKGESLYAEISECIILCGHYEGIDERIITLYNVEKISIGEYVLSSGELAASVLIDMWVRHIPGVLWNPESLEEESFSEKLDRKKEYPQYTRPRVFAGLSVPKVLVSGNHGEIEKWKRENLG